jgi:hypothetical protein
MASPSSSGTDLSTGTSLDDLLDCLITDLQLGKEAISLRASPRYSIPMTPLSRRSLIPTQVIPRGSQKDDPQYSSVHHTPISDTLSDYSSSIYSEPSSILAERKSSDTTMSSFPVDESLTPKPLCLSRVTSVDLADCPPNALAEDTISVADDSPCSEAAILLDLSRPKSAVDSDKSLDSESEALMEEIVRYPMVQGSPTDRFIQTPPKCGHFTVNQKAARLLGLDGAGYVSHPSGAVSSC